MTTPKNEKLFHILSEIREDLIEKADTHHFKKKKKTARTLLGLGTIAAAAALVIAANALLGPAADPETVNAYAVSEAEYPKMAPYPDETAFTDEASGEFDSDGFSKAYDAWNTSRQSQLAQPKGYADGLDHFYRQTIRQFLSGTDQNTAYSPLNVYLALGMLAELSGQNSRAQVLDLLGCEDLDALRAQARALWNANYNNDGAVTSILASSLWMNENIQFTASTIEQLSNTYYASAYQGSMGSGDFNKKFQDWLNSQTGGLLKDEAAQINLTNDTILALATTIFFQAKWEHEFSSADTAPGTFHTKAGETECSFMHQSTAARYYWGSKFSATAVNLMHSGAMWFILPDEGISMDELLSDSQAIDFILAGQAFENQKDVLINLAIPKFDITSQMELQDGLKELGVTDVFDPASADFTPMARHADDIAVSHVSHDVRVTIDEEGCSAAAYTVMSMDGSGMPSEDEVDFVADRPFLFVITGSAGQPLFVGIINQP